MEIEYPDPTKVPYCRCRDGNGVSCFSVSRISKTDKNKDREFFACSISKEKGGCGFFAWPEDLYVDKDGLLKKKYTPPPEGYVKKKTPTEILDERISKLEESTQSMKEKLEQIHQAIDELRRPAKVQKTEQPRQSQGKK
jgi:hypothetical protein